MSQLYQNGQRFYRLLPGKYPDKRYDYWVLWQRVVQRQFLLWRWWAKKDGPFWLGTDGFQPIAGSERRSGKDRRNHGR